MRVKAMSAAALVVMLSSWAIGAPVVDGKVDSGEYSGGTVRSLAFYEHDDFTGKTVTGGTLYTYCDPVTKDLYVAFVQPLGLNDNTYGINVADDWNRDHKFGELVGSDKAVFDVFDSTGVQIGEFKVDYLHKNGQLPNGDDKYESMGVTGGDGGTTGIDESLITATSSLSYNFNTLGYYLTKDSPEIVNGDPVDYTLTGNDGDYTGWIFDMIYEAKIDGSVFGDECGSALPTEAHNSPAKVKAKYSQVVASLGDFVWEDLNHDGIQDPNEPGVDGVTVNLYGCGPDGAVGGSDDTFLDTMLTSGGGMYLFDELDPGNYYLEFIDPLNRSWTFQNQGLDDALDSDVDPATGLTVCTDLAANEHDPTWDAGIYRENGTTIPEPATGALLLLGLVAARRRRRK